MQHTHRQAPWILLTLRLGAALTTGCADLNDVDGVDTLASPGDFDHLESAELTGMTAILFRHSSICVPRNRIGLEAEVGDDVEFLSDEVADLEVPCPEAPTPASEVYFVGNSLIFDFHDLREPVTYPESELEGYEIVFERSCGDPVVANMTVDEAMSSMVLGPNRLESDFDRVYVNFAGMTIQPDTFLKVDLRVVDLECGNAP